MKLKFYSLIHIARKKLLKYNILPIKCRVNNIGIAKKLLSIGLPILLYVPIEKVRVNRWLGFKINKNDIHPYVVASNEYLNKRNECINYEESVFKKYYEHYRPTKISDVIGFEPLNKKNGIGPLHYSSPWGPLRVKNVHPLNYGHQWWGPRTSEWGEIELKRIHNLIDSIRDQGYSPNYKYGFIEGYIIIDNNGNYFVTIERGHHRAAVLSCLGHSEIPVLANKNRIVKESDVEDWPTVKNGMLTKREALKVFERIKEGKVPQKLYSIWNEKIVN